MKAFHGKQSIKDKYVSRVQEHIRLDNLTKGATGDNGKGCGIACTLDMVYDHSLYPIEIGIPEWMARLEDSLFEGMSLEKSKTFPEVFLKAIDVGADLEKVKTPFIIKVLERNLRSLDYCEFDKENNPEVVAAIEGSKKAVNMMIDAYKMGDESAAWSAARSVELAAAARAARSAAWAAESAASSAAWSAATSAESAARAAELAARSVRSPLWAAAFDEMADELVEILKGLIE